MGKAAQWAKSCRTVDRVTDTHGLRERKKDATRRALADTALCLALERGYDGFTIADVTDAVGVSRRTFSNYFPGKAECIVGAVDGVLSGFFEIARAVDPKRGVVDLLIEIIVSADEKILIGFEQFHTVLSTVPEVQAQIYALDQRAAGAIAVEIGCLFDLDPGDVRVELLAAVAMGAAHTCIERWFATGKPDGRAGLRTMLEYAMTVIDHAAVERLARH